MWEILVQDLGYSPEYVEVQFWLDSTHPPRYIIPLRGGDTLILQGDVE